MSLRAALTLTAGTPTLARRYVVRAARPRPVVTHGADRWVVCAIVALTGLSIVMVFNTSYFYATERFAGDATYVFRKHLTSITLGVFICAVASRLRSHTYARLAYPALALVSVALIAVLVPGVGVMRGGARRWIALGALNVQPSELAKAVVVLYLAHSIVRKADRVQTFIVGVLPHVIVVGTLAALVVAEPDFGTAGLLGVLLVTMLAVGGARWRDLATAAAPAVVLAAVAILHSPYRLARVLAFLNPWAHARGSGFQLVQSFLAFGSGGMWGTGLGESKQKMFYLPEAHTDFILSVIGEELGLAGALAVVALFAVLALRGFRIALRHPTQFGRLVAFGLTLSLTLQAGINMAVVVGLLPTKGLALPFISYGGSAMLGAMASAGVLLALARESG